MTALDVDVVEALDIPRTMQWQEFAACSGRTRLFFPPKAERPQARERREAKALALCAACPVLGACRDFARSNREYGYWAGESEEDRHLAGFTVSAPIGIRARRDSRRRESEHRESGQRRGRAG